MGGATQTLYRVSLGILRKLSQSDHLKKKYVVVSFVSVVVDLLILAGTMAMVGRRRLRKKK